MTPQQFEILLITGSAGFLILIILLRRIMANQADVEAALQTLTTAISDTSTRVLAKLTALQAQIDAGASGPDLSTQVTEIQADVTALGSIAAS